MPLACRSYGPPGNYYERQVRRWTKTVNAPPRPKICRDDQLIENAEPRATATTTGSARFSAWRLSHRQYDVRKKTAPNCLAILDWELSDALAILTPTLPP